MLFACGRRRTTRRAEERDNVVAGERRRSLFLERKVCIAPTRYPNYDVGGWSTTVGFTRQRGG